MKTGVRRTIVMAAAASAVVAVCLANPDPKPARLDITEVSPVPLPDGAPWVELYNPAGCEPVAIHRLFLATGSSGHYRLPSGGGEIRANGYLLIRFDADPSTERYEAPAGGLVVFHARASLVHSWKSGAGVVSLLVKRGILGRRKELGRVAWAAPGRPHDDEPRRRNPNHHRVVYPGFGSYSGGDTLRPGDSIGVYLDLRGGLAGGWTVFRFSAERDLDEVTPGRENAVPRPAAFTLPDGAVVGSEELGISWVRLDSRESYELELGRVPGGEEGTITPLGSATLRWGEGIPEGTYHYRVRRRFGSRHSAWSIARSFTVVPTWCGDPSRPAIRINQLSEMQQRYQRKDTRLWCVACATPNWPQVSQHVDQNGNTVTVDPGNCRSYPNGPWGDHGGMYCGYASISMMISTYHRKCLSQDLIALAINRNLGEAHGYGLVYCPPPDPQFDDFGWVRPHEKCRGSSLPPGGEFTLAMAWAYGAPLGVQEPPGSLTQATYHFSHRPPAFREVEGWINAGRPIMSRMKTKGEEHVRTIKGCCVNYLEQEWLKVLDPSSGPRWESYDTWKKSAVGLWVGPPPDEADAAREDPDEVWEDADGDGRVDFYERRRGGS